MKYCVTILLFLLVMGMAQGNDLELVKGVEKISSLVESFGTIESCDCDVELEAQYDRTVEQLEKFFEQALLHLGEGDFEDFKFRPIKCEPQKGELAARQGAAVLFQKRAGQAASASVAQAEEGGIKIFCQFEASFYVPSFDRRVNIDGHIHYVPNQDCPPTNAKTPCVRMKIEKAKLNKQIFFMKDLTKTALRMARELQYKNIKVSQRDKIITFEKLDTE